MKDIKGAEIQLGDHLIITVSRKSHYLTSATVEKLQEDGSIVVRYSSTIATKTLRPGDLALIFMPRPYVLDGRLGLCRDCVNQIIEPGQKVLYRDQRMGMSISAVSKVVDELWVELEDGSKVRNVGIYVMS